tara:strand:+ start:772 stop:1659 length:888 start_codon:yes stop_codon:yes gene_type:complete
MKNEVILKDVVEGLKSHADNSIDCIILDPPYNIGKDFGNNTMKTEMKEYIQWADTWISECERVLKDSGTMFIYGLPEILAYVSVNLNLDHKWLVWHYTNKTVPSLNFWQMSHESLLCIWKDKSKRIFNRDEVREKYTDGFVKGYKGKNRTRPGTDGRFGKDKETTYTVNEKGALPRDVLKVSSLAGGAGSRERFVYCSSTKTLYTRKHAKALGIKNGISHPTQKPVMLTDKLIRSCMVEDMKVLIPFAGTGSECFVCDDLGISWEGYDINQEYVDMANLLVKNGFPKNPPKKLDK